MEAQKALGDFFKRLNALGTHDYVGGSVASSAHGSPRQTNDVDIVLRADERQVDAFVAEFEEDFMVSRQMVKEAIASADPYRSFPITHYDSCSGSTAFCRLQTTSLNPSSCDGRSTTSFRD